MNNNEGFHHTYGSDADGALLLAIRSPEGKVIATVPLRSTTGPEWDGGKGIEQAKADAQLIVDALNAYPHASEALAALKLCYTLIRRDGVRPDIFEGIKLHERADEAARIAIAKAEGRTA